MCFTVQKATSPLSKGRDKGDLSGVGDHGTLDIDMLRQLGRSYRSFLDFFFEEYGEQAIQSEGTKRLIGSRIAA